MARNNLFIILFVAAITGIYGCSKLVAIPVPINSITKPQVFSTDANAASALAGIYTQMINGPYGNNSNSFNAAFSEGLATVAGGLSADELVVPVGAIGGEFYYYETNKLIARNNVANINTIWQSAYSIIAGTNAILEGVAASSSPQFTDSARRQVTGEAKFIRAFCYFYLTNFFGDLPLILSTDFNQTAQLPRTPQTAIYQQIIQDLKDAESMLPGDNAISNGERVRPNKWAACALLARVYLFTADYNDAAAQASLVIASTSLYTLVSDPNNVFLAGSTEAIWQLKQYNGINIQGNATPEGIIMLPNPLNTGFPAFSISPQLLNAFEPGDARRAAWIDSTNYSGPPIGGTSYNGLYYFPYKYKMGTYNMSVGGTITEYYMVLRLAEQYLIRAEAESNGASGGLPAAIADLNILRNRANLSNLSNSLDAAAVQTAVAHEWQTETFCEWGQRWFNLKRTGKAHEVLSGIPAKQPWAGDYQLLYPIPIGEIIDDNKLTQNPGF